MKYLKLFEQYEDVDDPFGEEISDYSEYKNEMVILNHPQGFFISQEMINNEVILFNNFTLKYPMDEFSIFPKSDMRDGYSISLYDPLDQYDGIYSIPEELDGGWKIYHWINLPQEIKDEIL